MGKQLQKIYENKTFLFPWGMNHLTFTQFIDGSKAALCPENNRYYWLYFDPYDTEMTNPVKILEMTEGEADELEYQDILSDLADANQKGMYPEVTDTVRQILTERNVRRKTIFTLNMLDERRIRQEPGIVYLISRQVLKSLNKESLNNELDLNTAIGAAIREFQHETKN